MIESWGQLILSGYAIGLVAGLVAYIVGKGVNG